MGVKTNEEYLTGLRDLPLESLKKLHDGWVKELNIPKERRSTLTKNGNRMDDEGCRTVINLFRILINEKETTND